VKLKITIVRSIGLCIALAIGTASFAAASELGYDALIQQGKSQLQAGSAEPALAVGQSAIKIDKDRWEGYALAGGAQMNLKRYEPAADTLTEAIKRAPESKQAALRELRRQCLTAETSPPGAAAIPSAPIQAPTTQAEIVMWKSIEHSGNPADFQTYLEQYPQGAFVALARRHMEDAKANPVALIQPAAPPQPAATTPTPSLTLGAEVGKYIVAQIHSGGQQGRQEQ
jgi:tetratricopeptide (TPR) repeat protein